MHNQDAVSILQHSVLQPRRSGELYTQRVVFGYSKTCSFFDDCLAPGSVFLQFLPFHLTVSFVEDGWNRGDGAFFAQATELCSDCTQRFRTE